MKIIILIILGYYFIYLYSYYTDIRLRNDSSIKLISNQYHIYLLIDCNNNIFFSKTIDKLLCLLLYYINIIL